MFEPKNHIDELIDLARKASNAIMEYYKNDVVVTRKDDGSPVTLADQASEDILIAGLQKLSPNIPIIAEESAEAGKSPDISNIDQYWLIDPLDGTKEFIKGTKDFTINIGLIKNGTPVFGLVYLPATNDIYYGGENIGAFLNDKPITTHIYNKDNGLVVVGNKDTKKSDRWVEFLGDHHISHFTTRGSSLKFCLIADGSAELYPRFIPTYEWDTAAAHALLLQTGGDIIDFETNKRLTYGKTNQNYLNGYIITATNTILNIFFK